MSDISTWNRLSLNYWAITKCANTTIKTHLYKLETGKDFDNKKHTLIHGRAGLTYINKNTALNNGFLNFTVTRNPYDRFLSMYRDLVLSRPKRGRTAGINNNYTVDELLSYIESLEDSQRDVHFRSQSWFITEHLDVEINLKNLSTWPLSIPSPEIIKHKSKERFNKLTRSQKDKIYKIYKEDFIRFNYLK